MARNSSVEKLLEEIDKIVVEVRSLINDGCPGIKNLGEQYHIKSLERLKDELQNYRKAIQKTYDSDNSQIAQREEQERLRREKDASLKNDMLTKPKSQPTNKTSKTKG